MSHNHHEFWRRQAQFWRQSFERQAEVIDQLKRKVIELEHTQEGGCMADWEDIEVTAMPPLHSTQWQYLDEAGAPVNLERLLDQGGPDRRVVITKHFEEGEALKTLLTEPPDDIYSVGGVMKCAHCGVPLNECHCVATRGRE